MAANQTPADVIAAMYQQYLAGGTTPQLWQGNVSGPQVGGGAPEVAGGDGGASGFAELGQGILDYLGDEDEEVKKKPSGILNQSAWTPENAQQPAAPPPQPQPGQMAPPQMDNSPVTATTLPPPASPTFRPDMSDLPEGPPQPTADQRKKAATDAVGELSLWLRGLLDPS